MTRFYPDSRLGGWFVKLQMKTNLYLASVEHCVMHITTVQLILPCGIVRITFTKHNLYKSFRPTL